MKNTLHSSNNKYKNIVLPIVLFGLSFIYYNTFIQAEDTMVSRVQGKILLQVESNGEAWYIHPITDERYYLGRPEDAFALMNNLGLGITNNDIKKIAIAKASFTGLDTDNDGLSDLLEDAIGTDKNKIDSDDDGFNDKDEVLANFNPQGEGEIIINNDFAKKQAGRILIQAEQNGEAWYINPDNNKRYFLGRPSDAFNIMRQTGLGITNNDLSQIIAYSQQENHDTNNTVIVNNKRKFTDSVNNYSFEYPETWKKTTIQGKNEAIFLRNYEDDIIDEKKALITVAFIKSDQSLDLNKFKTASKDGGHKKDSESKEINNYTALQETFSFSKVDSEETTTYIQFNDTEMLMLTLFSAGNHNYHDSILGDILRSVKYTE